MPGHSLAQKKIILVNKRLVFIAKIVFKETFMYWFPSSKVGSKMKIQNKDNF